MPCMKLKMLPPTSTPLEIRCTECIYIYIYIHVGRTRGLSFSLFTGGRRMRERGRRRRRRARRRGAIMRLFIGFLFLQTNFFPPRFFLSLSTAYLHPPSFELFFFSFPFLHPFLVFPPRPHSARLTYQHCICCTVLCKCNQIICHLPGQIL